MAVEVKSAEEATDIAVKFIKKYRMIAAPLRAAREDDTWIVKVDVGPLMRLEASVKLDAKSGEILEYNIP